MKKIKLQDVGHRVRERLDAPTEVKNEVTYPSFYISGKDLKSLTGLKFNEDIQINAIGRIKGVSQHNDESPEFTIEIRKMGIRKKVLESLGDATR